MMLLLFCVTCVILQKSFYVDLGFNNIIIINRNITYYRKQEKEQHFLETEIFCNIINILSVTCGQFNAPLLK